MNPLISVIIPIYNVDKYLRECLDSVVHQTYQLIEIILIDDGSTDNCSAICDEYKTIDPRIKVVHKNNEGQGVARNVGISICNGAYILFVDGDDYISKNMVDTLVNCLDDDTDIVLCNITINNGIRLKKYNQFNECKAINRYRLFEMYLQENRIFTGPIGKMIRASIMKTVNFPNLRCNEDVYILHEIFDRCNKAYLCTENLYCIRIRNDMTSTEQKPYNHSRMNLILANDNLLKYTINSFPEFKVFVLRKRLNDLCFLIELVLKANGRNKYSEDFDTLISDFYQTYDELKPHERKYKILRNNIVLFSFLVHIRFFLVKIKTRIKLLLVKAANGKRKNN